MLTSEKWTEAKKNQLTIDDFEPAVIKGMLHFAYTGELTNEDIDHLE